MKRKILIFGNGFIGARLAQDMDSCLSEKRVRSIRDVEDQIGRYHPTIIINCIGHTGESNVDECESDKDKTLVSNTFVPIAMLEAALRHGIKLVHIGSGCIYRGDTAGRRALPETKAPDFFQLYYSRTKIYAERALDALSRDYAVLILRLRIPLDSRPHPRNILTKLINYKKAINVPNSVTYIPDFVGALKHLLRIDARGIYNVVNKGALRYPRLLDIYKRYVPDFKYETVDFKELKLVRTNLILSAGKLEKTGFKMRAINEVLEECVREYVKY